MTPRLRSRRSSVHKSFANVAPEGGQAATFFIFGDGAAVRVLDWQPEQRCALEDFDWLAVTPSPNGYVPAVATNGQHPLPPRTAQYLASGAHNGSRNAELFAAACQMRDAGYSQTDAERELIGRHVASGNGSENPAAREKEARATIASAYRQAPREPIAARRSKP